MLKKLLRLAALLIVAATIVWLTREHLLPSPRVTDEKPPHFRSTPPAPAHDDLTSIKGIGPVYAGRLAELGVRSFQALSEQDPATTAKRLGTTQQAVTDWVAQAKNRLG